MIEYRDPYPGEDVVEDEDIRLLRRYHSTGDEETISQLIHKYQKMVFNVCRRRLDCIDDAEDATQQVFLAMMKNAESININLRRWLYRCSANICASMIRSYRSRIHREREKGRQTRTYCFNHGEAERKENVDILMDCFHDLNASNQKLLMDNQVRGVAQQTIAMSMGVTQQAIAKRLGKLLSHLRRELTSKGVAFSLVMSILLATRRASAKVLPCLKNPLVSAPSGMLATGAGGIGVTGALKIGATASLLLVTAVAYHPSSSTEIQRKTNSSSANAGVKVVPVSSSERLAPNHSYVAIPRTFKSKPASPSFSFVEQPKPSLVEQRPGKIAEVSIPTEITNTKTPDEVPAGPSVSSTAVSTTSRNLSPARRFRTTLAGRKKKTKSKTDIGSAVGLVRQRRETDAKMHKADPEKTAMRNVRQPGRFSDMPKKSPGMVSAGRYSENLGRSIEWAKQGVLRRIRDAYSPALRRPAYKQNSSLIGSFIPMGNIRMPVERFALTDDWESSIQTGSVAAPPVFSPSTTTASLQPQMTTVAENTFLSMAGKVGDRLVNQGTIFADNGLYLTGLVSGRGSYVGDVVFAGEFSPGNSPAAVHLDTAVLDQDNILTMELAGLEAGSQYDQIIIDNHLTLGGILDVELIYGFIPKSGDTFHLFDGSFSGEFSSVMLPVLTHNLFWDTSDLYVGGNLHVGRLQTTIPEPTVLLLLTVGGIGVLVRRSRLHVHDLS